MCSEPPPARTVFAKSGAGRPGWFSKTTVLHKITILTSSAPQEIRLSYRSLCFVVFLGFLFTACESSSCGLCRRSSMASRTHFPSHLSGTHRTRSDPHIRFIPHPHVGLSNLPPTPRPQPLLDDYPLDASMDKYKKQQRQHEWGWRINPVDDGRRTNMRKVTETAEDNNHSNGTNLNFTPFSPHEKPRSNRGGGGEESRGRSPRPEYRKNPKLSPRPSVNTKKLVNWRLACFMSKEYLTRGTLLGRAWPPQDSKNAKSPDTKSQAKLGSLDREADGRKREKERLYYTLSDFLRAGDVHLPEIVNPSQLAAWLGVN